MSHPVLSSALILLSMLKFSYIIQIFCTFAIRKKIYFLNFRFIPIATCEKTSHNLENVMARSENLKAYLIKEPFPIVSIFC